MNTKIKKSLLHRENGKVINLMIILIKKRSANSQIITKKLMRMSVDFFYNFSYRYNQSILSIFFSVTNIIYKSLYVAKISYLDFHNIRLYTIASMPDN